MKRPMNVQFGRRVTALVYQALLLRARGYNAVADPRGLSNLGPPSS